MAFRGRNMLIKVNTGSGLVTIGGMQTKTFTINRDLVDITTFPTTTVDVLWRKLLANMNSNVSIGGSCVFKDDVGINLISSLVNSGELAAFELEFENGDTVSGDFQVSSLEHSGEYLDAHRATMTLEGSGDITLVRADASVCGILPAVSGLRGCWGADNITVADGANITGWPDSSGNGFDAGMDLATFPNSNPQYVENVVNGHAVVRMGGAAEGNQDHISIPQAVFNSVTEAEIFIVLKNDFAAPADTNNGIWKWNDIASAHHPFDGDGQIYEDFGTSVRKSVGSPLIALNTWHIHNVYSAANDYAVYLNGNLQFSSGTNVVQFWAQDAIIGISWVTVFFPVVDMYDGDIAAVIFYDRKLTTTERTNVTNALKTYYGIV